jgi:hypothetical protein
MCYVKRKKIRQRRRLAWIGFLLAATVSVCRGQTTNHIIDQFDTYTTASYINQFWGTAVPSIKWDDTVNAVSSIASNHPGSGSAKWVVPWTTTNDQIMVTRALGATLNLNQFAVVSYDIQFAASSATDGAGNFGAIEVDWVPASVGWPSTPNSPQSDVVFAGGNTNWIHVSMPVSAAGNTNLNAVNGIGFKIRQASTGANLTGTTTFWLDNIILSGFTAPGATGPAQIVPLSSAQPWQRLEFQITNVPTVSNPFDPDLIRLDATFTPPSGSPIVVPAFWYQGYQRSLSGGSEYDTETAPPQWRLRYLPPAAGVYTLSVAIETNGHLFGTVVTNFTVASAALPARFGYVGLAQNRQYFQTGDGQALPLNGEDVAWPSSRGTYDYDGWFASMQAAGENFARVWMWPSSFGIEDAPGTLNNYALDPAWQLDYVLQLAEQSGIYIQLCLDYHGMFATLPDMWGGNNYWPQNPYNVTNGGPCLNANGFFTNTTAQAIYQKRLRYLIGRYGYSQNLLGWEFLNEIDNEYAILNSTNVAAWHALMGGWLQTNDVFAHLRTTSLSYASAHPEIWSLPQLSYSSEHSYGESSPSSSLAADAQSFLQSYGKPLMIGEFGTSYLSWNSTNDPYLRGFRQGLWGGALGGSAGTAMSWWWQNIDSEDDYPVYSALADILGRTGWGRGAWTNIVFQTSGSPPVTVGGAIPGGQPFDVQLLLDPNWGDMVAGRIAIPNAQAAIYSPEVLNGFVQGTSHPDLRTPFQLSAWFASNASVVLHLNSVSWGSTMMVLVDGAVALRTNLPNLDDNDVVDEEYNTNFSVNVAAGQHLVTITNGGADWFYLDWVQLNQVLPATYAGNWQPSPNSIGLGGSHESLLYVVAPGVSFPSGATNALLPAQQNATITLTNWPAGTYFAQWYDPSTATPLGRTEAATTNGGLTLPMPEFSVDLAGILYPPPNLAAAQANSNGSFQFQLNSETGGEYTIEESSDLRQWTSLLVVTNVLGTSIVTVPESITNATEYFRARQN